VIEKNLRDFQKIKYSKKDNNNRYQRGWRKGRRRLPFLHPFVVNSVMIV
jgi:hypothetical protein